MADLDIGDIEKENFNSEVSSSDSSSSDSNDDSDSMLEKALNGEGQNQDDKNQKKSKKNKANKENEENEANKENNVEINNKNEEKKIDNNEEKKEENENEDEEDEEEEESDEKEDKKSSVKNKDKSTNNKKEDKKSSKAGKKSNKKEKNEDNNINEAKKSKSKKESNKIKEIKLNTKKNGKSSKGKSNKTESVKYQENVETGLKNNDNLIIEKNSSSYFNKISNNKFYIPRNNKRLETLMNCLSASSSSSEKEIEINKDKKRMQKEKEIIKKEKESREKFKKIDDIRFQIKGKDKTISEIMKNDELNLQNEKISYLEEKNMRLDRLNQIYYDIIKSTNLDLLRNNSNNKNDNLKLQSLDFSNNNNKPNFFPNNPDNLDFMIQNYIDGERNKNIHKFSDSMIDINQKITNYLIDNCLKEKEKNKFIEDFRSEIGQKLDKIEKIQKMQKHDIDFIIKYGLNKNKAIDPIIDLLYIKKSLPKLLRDEDEDYNGKIVNGRNFNSYKNFLLHGRYTNDKIDNKSSPSKNGNVLKRTGSYIFENRNNYKLKENEGYSKQDPNIRKEYFEKKEKLLKLNRIKNNEKYEEEEFEKFVAYKGRFFIPKDFKFGNAKENKTHLKKPKNDNKIIDFIF